ncbi:MAG TPA: hypothetical protein VHM30_04935, partial [Gemmatimonadaceae bacterium]|nr:hypothetical protein [Gemmatimonadaceae bacterium]
EPAFETYRRELAAADLPVTLAVHYHLIAGKGYEAFGRIAQARRSLDQAIELASTHRLNQLLFTAENSLRELEAGARSREAAKTDVAVPEGIVDVASAIQDLRAAVGVPE